MKFLARIFKALDPWNFTGKSFQYHIAFEYEESNRNEPHELYQFFKNYTESNNFTLTKEEQIGAPRDRVILYFQRNTEKIIIEYCIDRGCCVSSKTVNLPKLYQNHKEEQKAKE